MITNHFSFIAGVVLSLMIPALQAAETGGNAQQGKALWNQSHNVGGQERRCTTCHGQSPDQPGKHVRTGKVIKPMAVRVNPDRFSDKRKAAKWFKRNCRWTIGRECTAQEQADIAEYLKTY